MKRMITKTLPILLSVALSVDAGELKLSPVFGDHMVLQRDMPVKVWGSADPGAAISVKFSSQTKTVNAGSDGSWMATLDPMTASTEPRELIVESGSAGIKASDILVGEVWLLGGQSNMEMPLWWRGDGMENAKDTRLVLGTDHPWLRVMTVPQGVAQKPRDSFLQGGKDGDGVMTGQWFVSQDKHAAISGFSALGYFIGTQLHEKIGVPIGLIDTSWGGTIASAWNSRESLSAIPEASEMVGKKEAAAAAWTEDGARQQFEADLKDWESKVEQAKSENKKPPGKPSIKPDPGQDRNFPAGPFNAMIWPLRHMSLRGVFFYQGENNFFDRVDPFTKTFPAVVTSWRHAFENEKLPFCIFQICGWGEKELLYWQTMMPIIQEAQHKAHLAQPGTGFVVTTDHPHADIHPMKKRPIAERAVRWAMSEIYGRKEITWGTASLMSSKLDGTRFVLTFKTPGNESLKITGEPSGIAIAGKDGKFIEARAELLGPHTLAVWSDKLPDPVTVRYAWSQRAIIHLYTESGLPVGPFRTDDFAIPRSEIRD